MYIPNKVFQICCKGSLIVDVDWGGVNKYLSTTLVYNNQHSAVYSYDAMYLGV